ncbi:MAG: YqiJ family protein [Phycisphaerae bacterium]|nr:YqiJ family protein [Phycisphaerae bacterium]
MVELMQLAFSPINVVFTLLLITIVIYWLVVIVGVLDTDLFDFDMPEMDGDLDAGSDVDLGPGMAWGILHWFHVGEIPVMVLLSCFILSLWAIAILGNYYLNPGQHILQALGVFICNVAISSLVVKCVALPLRPLYALFYKDFNAPRKVIGSQGLVVTTQVTAELMGQLEVHTKGAPIRLNVRSKHDHVFHEHDPAVIVERDQKSNIYFIVPPK